MRAGWLAHWTAAGEEKRHVRHACQPHGVEAAISVIMTYNTDGLSAKLEMLLASHRSATTSEDI